MTLSQHIKRQRVVQRSNLKDMRGIEVDLRQSAQNKVELRSSIEESSPYGENTSLGVEQSSKISFIVMVEISRVGPIYDF